MMSVEPVADLAMQTVIVDVMNDNHANQTIKDVTGTFPCGP